jgi:hypothetical protein
LRSPTLFFISSEQKGSFIHSFRRVIKPNHVPVCGGHTAFRAEQHRSLHDANPARKTGVETRKKPKKQQGGGVMGRTEE